MVVSLPEAVVKARSMEVRCRFTFVVLGIATCVAAGCTRDLDPATMQMTGTGGIMTGSGGNPGATDARVKTDSACQYDVDAVHVSTENSSDACLFLIEYPTDANLPSDAFRVVVDGVRLPQDPTNGWTYTDATQRVVRIVGPA